MNGALSQTVCRIRLFLLAVMCWLCLVPAAHAIRPPSPAEIQLREETPSQEQPAYEVVLGIDAEGRIGLLVLNDPLRYTDPDGHGAIGDALFSQETYTSSYQLLTMHDSAGWRAVEIPVAIGGMAIATADTALNFASLGGKGALEGGLKAGAKVGLEKLGTVEGEKAGAKVVKGGIEAVNKGKVGEALSEKEALAAGEKIRGKQVTLELPSGKRARPDLLTETEQGELKVREAKNGPTAKLTPGQTELKQTTQSGGSVIPRGANAKAAGLEPGKPTQIPHFETDKY